ncbi:ABC transporter ATP-binding protein [Thalassotalea marina]|uniref:Macrolide ABC transporter ATP-binding protein n=1 Tax=Thalassotalea marina TaxID=1673741 RepID=A0A919BLC5_9GAMM|nr:ABC transporter ATP-binding protein [Thalassotalea marina]GHF97947.1 macrolide ABC transporter ATP-binding protein [Thalassotalea marina]
MHEATRKIISVQNLSKSFAQTGQPLNVLHQVNMDVFERDMLAIVGPSGSGKSTLLSLLGLLDEPSSGHYMLCNSNVETLSNYQKSRLRNENIGWVFQNFNLIEDMTVAENIQLPLRFNKNIAKAEYAKRTTDVLAKVGLPDKANAYPAQLSGGQQQRISIARALVTQPDILLCDEPTGNLDSENSAAIMALFKSLNDSGVTIVIITHSDDVANDCHQIYQMKDGHLSKKFNA